MPRAMRWISIEDELPEYGLLVILVLTLERSQGLVMGWRASTDSHGEHFRTNGGNAVDGITHWMPLPAKPKTGGK